MRVAGAVTVILLLFLPIISACSTKENTESEATTQLGTNLQSETPVQASTIEANTKGIVNYTCHWPSTTSNTAIIKYDNRAIYCAQSSCQMSSEDIVGAIPAGIKVISKGGTELVKVEVLNGHYTGSTGFLSSECVDWGSDGNHLTGAPVELHASIATGTWVIRKAYAKQVVKENEESLQYSGFHGTVTVNGPNGTIMQYYDPDVSATTVTNDTDFIKELRKRGFRKLVFKDGTGTWDVDLSKEPAVPVAR